ncbi:MAG TPA: carboxypeptidase-like regulatory domain-containing protein [Verrucomicrobiae bacterium]|nr:carboxypeptidase-like regulatory domain-containing protein [Verrucomicrobiae bacterium]
MWFRPALAGVIVACVLAFPAWAAPDKAGRKDNEYESRTVSGTVFTAHSRPARSAVVYLYDERNKSVRTYITNQTGHYRFSGLFDSDDYEVYAARSGWTSKTRTISNFSNRQEFVINLKIFRRA